MKIIVLTFPDSEEQLVEDIIAKLSHVAGCTHSNQEQHIWTFPGLEIHLRKQIICRNGLPVPLSHYEFFILCFLPEHPGWVYTKEQIYEAVWNEPGDCLWSHSCQRHLPGQAKTLAGPPDDVVNKNMV